MTETFSEEAINAQAEQSGFARRRSKLNGVQFLKMILFDQIIIDQPSLQQHCTSIFSDRRKKISKQALDKRFNANAVSFIQNLFEQYLQRQLSANKLSSTFSDHFSAIRIMDSTEFKLPECMAEEFPGFGGDGTKSCTQIQYEYDILSSKINHFRIGNARTTDFAYASDYLDSIQSGELIIRDLGYSKIGSFKEMEERKAFYISRLHPQTNIYERQGKAFVKLSYQSIIKRLKKSGRKYLDMPIYLGDEWKHPVRLTANLLTEDARKRRLTKKIYRKNKDNKKYKSLSHLNLFITNVPHSILSPDQVHCLYRVRWQIELIFKTWKSVLKLNQVRKMKAYRFKCYLLSKLLWIVMSWEVWSLFNERVRQVTNCLLSVYKCFAIIKSHASALKQIFFSHQKENFKRWLKNLYEILAEFGLKENRKGRINLITLLMLK